MLVLALLSNPCMTDPKVARVSVQFGISGGLFTPTERQVMTSCITQKHTLLYKVADALSTFQMSIFPDRHDVWDC